ncbi:MAG: TatD family hydrolase [Oscillospiraceae bacterium]|nr:TatD family hydrolase [Oscillospiraceae bacterium]
MNDIWYFDSHAHYDARRFREDQEAVLAQMAPARVRRIMNIGCDLASSHTSIALAEQYDFIYAAVGSHPDDAAAVDDALVAQYRILAQHPKVRAIGEIGLDYYYEDVPREKQQEAFRLQLALAKELDMPVIIHQRDAYEDTLKIVDEFPGLRGVFHCFSGSVEYAKEVLKRGFYLGFTGVITFKNARKAVEVAEYAPLHRLLIETDCPYMAPEPFRGKRCDSTMLPRMAEKIAQLRGLPVAEIARITRENAMALFGVDAP